MGQYFTAVNTTKKEYVCAWCIGGVAKLWEWAANPQGAIFVLLLRKSTGTGGGDYDGYRTQELPLDDSSPERLHESMQEALRSAASFAREHEGKRIEQTTSTIVGSWAGDAVYLVGDYDDSRLYQKARASYRNISKELVAVWNDFIEYKERRLRYEPCDSCGKRRTKKARREAAAL